MTSNQIDYYNARMKAKNDKLTRRETKRHNKAVEGAQNLSASAALSQAAAAQSQANTAAKRYQLEWETEYGFPYGTSSEYMNNPDNWGVQSEESMEKSFYTFPKNALPQSYVKSQFEIVKAGETAKTEQTKRYKNYSGLVSDIAKAAENLGKTYIILTD